MSAPLTTASMAWHGPRLDEDENDVLKLLDTLAGDRGVVLTDDATVVGTLIAELAELGIWTVGTDESHGGGGAAAPTSTVVWERLGRYWPALGWASVQAHAALAVLGSEAAALPGALSETLVSQVHAGSAAVAVVEAAPPQVRLDRGAGTVSGHVIRLDAAHLAPHLLLLDGDDCLFVPADRIAYDEVARTGLAGALTRSARFSDVEELRLPDAARARTIARRGGAVVAAGIAGAAADTSASYTHARHQFGGPLIDLPTVRRSVHEQRATVRLALSAVAGLDDHAVAAGDLLRQACTAAVDVTAAALQTHGGYGYLTEYPVERYVRDAVSLRAALSGLQPDPQVEM